MARWSDIAPWIGPLRNSGDGDGRELEPEDAMSAHMGLVVHTAEGSYDGTIAWQKNPAAEVGSHFLGAKDGRRAQLIDTRDRSWCQSGGNSTWVSLENEGFGARGEALTNAQCQFAAELLARLHREHGVPLQVSNSPSTPGLGWHGMGGAGWGGHYDCPGDAIRAQLPGIVARAAAIINGNGDDMSAEAENAIRAIVQGLPSANGNTNAIWQWRTRDEKWQAGINAMLAADEVRDKAVQAAVEGLVAAIRAGGGSVDAAPIVAAVNAVRDEARKEFGALHEQNAELQARVEAFEAQVMAYESREAAAAQAEADALAPPQG